MRGASFKRVEVRLRRALLQGKRWNWVYWRATAKENGHEVLVAEVPLRFVQLIEEGALKVAQAASTLALRAAPSLSALGAAPAWGAALRYLLGLRVDARRAFLYGETALELALAGKWAQAEEAAQRAADIERSYSGRLVRWRALLYAVREGLVSSGDV